MKGYSILLVALALTACATAPKAKVMQTSASGDKYRQVSAVSFKPVAQPVGLTIYADQPRQTIDGFGGSLTESSAFVLACIPAKDRQAILEELFSERGANFSMVRTQIGASDFSVEGLYSLCEKEGDTALETFSLDRDKEGFSKDRYPYIQDEHYDLYHLMKEVAAIKAAQKDPTYRIFANTWTAPAWMKDNGKYYERHGAYGRGGALLSQYYQTYADYLIKYIEAYKAEGIDIWAVSPVNEPMGNDGGWESMDFWPAVEAEFIGKNLGPSLKAKNLDVQIFGFDQNIFEMPPYTAAIYGDEKSREYTDGMAIHWYGSTVSCFPEVLDSIHNAYPDKRILHTEGCVDNLGLPAWGDVIQDPEGFKECCWFENDEFWWTKSATDWAYSTPWWPEWHPKYSPVHRYAQYILDGLNHWMTGYIDWNIVLDSLGGPNHVGNYAAAPVMIDYQGDKPRIYFTPYYYVLKHFSRSMRPGDIVLTMDQPEDSTLSICAVQKADGTIVVNVINTAEEARTIDLTLSGLSDKGDLYSAQVKLPANSLQTLCIR